MSGKSGEIPNLKCKYYTKALCLRDSYNACENCPYFKTYKNENKNLHKASKGF